MIKDILQMLSVGGLIAAITVGVIFSIVYSEQQIFYVHCKVFGEYKTMGNDMIYCSIKQDKENGQATNQ